MKQKRILSALLALLLLLFPLQGLAENALYQVSTLQALMQGDYYGAVTVQELLRSGNTGLGTFDGLDGEMIVLDGVAYKAAYDGSIQIAPPEETVPFANVAQLDAAEAALTSFTGGYDGLLAALSAYAPENNMPLIILATGLFQGVTVRSVPKQQEPYPPLTDVVQKQAVFTKEQVQGTVVGFRFPAYFGDINTTGYHLHFLSADHTFGGHLLDAQSGDIAICGSQLDALHMVLPETITQYNVSQTTDNDIAAVESR